MKSVDARYPAEIHALWASLDREVTWLHGRWIIYRQLYGTSAERMELLNVSAGTFFVVVHEVLLHDVQLSLSKLGDAAGSGSRENMTLDALYEALIAIGETAAADQMKAAALVFADAWVKVRHRRNKWIAHFDRSTMLNQDTVPRMEPSREEIENALGALRGAMNSISIYYTGITTMYDDLAMVADGEALIHNLQRGLRYKELVSANAVSRSDYIERFSGKV